MKIIKIMRTMKPGERESGEHEPGERESGDRKGRHYIFALPGSTCSGDPCGRQILLPIFDDPCE